MKVYQYFLLLLAVPMACQSMEEHVITARTGEVLPKLMREIQIFQGNPQAMHDHLEGRLKVLGERMPKGKDLNDTNVKAFTKLTEKLKEQSVPADPQAQVKRVVPARTIATLVSASDDSLRVARPRRKSARPGTDAMVLTQGTSRALSDLMAEMQQYKSPEEKEQFFKTELEGHGIQMPDIQDTNRRHSEAFGRLVKARSGKG